MNMKIDKDSKISYRDDIHPGMSSSRSLVKSLILFTYIRRDEISSRDEIKEKMRVNSSTRGEIKICNYNQDIFANGIFFYNELMHYFFLELLLEGVLKCNFYFSSW